MVIDWTENLIFPFIENRAKTRFDSIQSMSEAKHALKTLFDVIGEKKIGSSTQLLELQHENSEVSVDFQTCSF